jgi:hypothetical protein
MTCSQIKVELTCSQVTATFLAPRVLGVKATYAPDKDS